MSTMIPLIIFTVCGGAAAGMAALLWLCQPSVAAGKPLGALSRPTVFLAIDIVLLGLGLLGTLLHLGQPGRFLNGLANPQSMIAQEGYWSIALGILLVVALVVSLKRPAPKALLVATALIGVGLMAVTSLAYYFSAGLPSWNNGVTLLVFFGGDFALGAALCLLFLPNSKPAANCTAILCALTLLTAVAYCAQASTASALTDTVVGGCALSAAAAAVALALRLLAGSREDSARFWIAAMSACAVLSVVFLRIAFFASAIGA